MQPLGHSAVLVSAIAVSAIANKDNDYDPDFGFDFVTVGDIDNPPYTNGFGVDPDGRGSVGHEYRISRLELTSGQYLEFFNLFFVEYEQFFALLPRGESSFYWIGPGVPLRYANGLNDPANAGVQLSWRQAAMFCNWMHNGQQESWESLLDGAYDVSTFTRDPDFGDFHDQAVRHPDARYWIPSLDEYLKAAFYDPDKEGNGPGWWSYGHSSDQEIINGLPGVGEVARGIPIDTLRDLFGIAIRVDRIPLGLYPDVQSPWGLLDVLGGNAEWVEDWEDGEPRRRVVKLSSNSSHDLWGTVVDDVSFLWGETPVTTDYGLRIASAVRNPADLNRDWSVNFFDVSDFVSRYTQGDLSVDFNKDSTLSSDDVLVFLNYVIN